MRIDILLIVGTRGKFSHPIDARSSGEEG